MGRSWTFMDEAFHRRGYDPTDPGRFIPNTVFVIMTFSPDMEESFQAIRDGAATLGLRAQRADDSVGSGIILNQITKSIQDAEFVVVDLTHERPNVYYELGFTHGAGNVSADVLLVARAGTVLHFDIGPMRVRFYSSVAELTKIVCECLGKMIEVTRRSSAQAGPMAAVGGMFSLTFRGPTGTFGGGLILVQNGIIHGGDDSYLYLGRYRVVSGEAITGELTVTHYHGSDISVLGKITEAQLSFAARQEGNGFAGEAQVCGQSSLRLEIRGQRVADALT